MDHVIHESALLRTRLEQLERDLRLLPPTLDLDGVSLKVISSLFLATGMDVPSHFSVDECRLAIMNRLLLPDLREDTPEATR